MLVRPQIHEHHSHALRSSAVRVGLVVGVGLSLALTGWIYVANRVPIFDHASLERNHCRGRSHRSHGVYSRCCVSFASPADLLASSLIAWSILTLTYRTLSLFFWPVRDWYTTFQVFMLGAVLYMILATLSWIGTCIWKRAPRISLRHRHSAS